MLPLKRYRQPVRDHQYLLKTKNPLLGMRSGSGGMPEIAATLRRPAAPLKKRVNRMAKWRVAFT